MTSGRVFKTSAAVVSAGQRRGIRVAAAPMGAVVDAFGRGGRDVSDARFEVVGAPQSMLSVTLSPSQNFFTRRGTLIAVAGKPNSLHSTLSILPLFPRAPLGVPFLYQRLNTTTPTTTLISPSSPSASLSVLHLDGTTDWIVSQRNALLAWTGHTLTLHQRLATSLSLSHWGTTCLTGRGLVALSSPGQIYQVTLEEGEQFTAHPSHIVAYTVTPTAPLPFRFASSVRMAVPKVVVGYFSSLSFIQQIRDSEVGKAVGRAWYTLRTIARQTIWGDRLFLSFQGPATLLVSSRGARIADILSRDEINEIADVPAGQLGQKVDKPKLLVTKSVEPLVKVEESKDKAEKVLEEKKGLKQVL